MPDLEGPEKYGGKILGQELFYQGRNGPLFLLVVGLLASIGVMIYFTIDWQRGIETRTTLRYESLVRTMQASETQSRIQNWLLSMKQEERPKLQMPPEAWGLLSEDAKQRYIKQYEDDYERRRR